MLKSEHPAIPKYFQPVYYNELCKESSAVTLIFLSKNISGHIYWPGFAVDWIEYMTNINIIGFMFIFSTISYL